jgi:hypothetical protein
MRNHAKADARLAGSVISATVPAPTEKTIHDPNAWKIRRKYKRAMCAGSTASNVLAMRKLPSPTIYTVFLPPTSEAAAPKRGYELSVLRFKIRERTTYSDREHHHVH